MKTVVRINLNNVSVIICEQETVYDYIYIIYELKGKRRIQIDDFDSLTQATEKGIAYCMGLL